MIDKFKGRYRILCEYNQETNDFSRKLNGTYEDIDCYISCQNGRIFHWGGNILEAYIPSIQIGRNIVKTIYANYINPKNVTREIKRYSVERNGEATYIERENISIISYDIYNSELSKNINIIFGLEETDSEVLFKFKYADSDKIIPLMKPKTSGASISPFSSKNLPKNKDYRISDEDFILYRKIIEKIPQNELLSITHTTEKFIKSLASKRNPIENIKADMKLKGLKGKEYIHSIGKWDEYIKYLEKNL